MKAAELKRFAVFADLSEEEQEEVASQLEPRRLAAGETLFVEGGEGDGLILLQEGALRLETQRTGERATVEAGACLGGLSLLSIGPRQVTATATRPTRFLLLRRAGYRRLVADCPRAACRLTETILAEVTGLARRSLDGLLAGPVDRSNSDA